MYKRAHKQHRNVTINPMLLSFLTCFPQLELIRCFFEQVGGVFVFVAEPTEAQELSISLARVAFTTSYVVGHGDLGYGRGSFHGSRETGKRMIPRVESIVAEC